MKGFYHRTDYRTIPKKSSWQNFAYIKKGQLSKNTKTDEKKLCMDDKILSDKKQ